MRRAIPVLIVATILASAWTYLLLSALVGGRFDVFVRMLVGS